MLLPSRRPQPKIPIPEPDTDPQLPRPRLALLGSGNMYMHVGDLRRAEVDLSAALEINAERPEIWNDRAACRSRAGRHDDALVDTEGALRLRPDFAPALSNRGNAYRALNQSSAAKAAYNAALLLDPLDARTWNNRGALQEESGNLVAAELDIRHALTPRPPSRHEGDQMIGGLG